MNERQQRGLHIAATCRIIQKGGVWLVPSQSGKGKYTVCPDPDNPHCTCQDHETRAEKCKHIFAVEYVIRREEDLDGSTNLTEKLTVTEPKGKTYRQDWRAYNVAQTTEKEQFQVFLHELCQNIERKPYLSKRGRPCIPLPDAIFSICFKTYSTFSGRRFMSDLRAAHAQEYIEKVPHFNSIFNYLENPNLTPLLNLLVVQSSLPLKAVEIDFACDSSGFTTSRFNRWFDHKYDVPRKHHHWVKVHIMCGIKTNVVTAVEIRDKDAHDSMLLPDLVRTTSKNFSIMELSADKAYGSLKNYDAIEAVGATPYIAFKKSHTGECGGLWLKMFHQFSLSREDFLEHYHKRSNVESTFSMIKAKFRDHVRSKSDVAMTNEVLCKIICHNICCVIQEMHELGIQPKFATES